MGVGEHNSINRRMPMIISCSDPVRSLLSKVFESHWPFANCVWPHSHYSLSFTLRWFEKFKVINYSLRLVRFCLPLLRKPTSL